MGRVFVIAEAGVNHNGSLERAKRMVAAAAAAGADAVKFQTFRADALASPRADKADYQRATTGSGSQLEMLMRLELSESDHYELMASAATEGIEFLSSPFERHSLAFLAQLGLSRLKVPSGELTNLPFIARVGATELPVILSTGMATLGEVENALGALAAGYLEVPLDAKASSTMLSLLADEGVQSTLAQNVTLLHCTSAYPCPAEAVNLRAMGTLRAAFGLPVGYSDHTRGIAVSTAAVALGATVIEKHFTLDCSLEGPDHAASLEPDELTAMCASIREVELALGRSLKAPSASELDVRKAARKSLVADAPIQRGDTFTEANLGIRRPGTGQPPSRWWSVLGTVAVRSYEAGEVIE